MRKAVFVKLKLSKLLKRQYIFCVSFCFVLLVGANVIDTKAYAAATNSRIDAILVMDTSGSMNASDRDRVSIEAAKMFVDMMDINGSRIGMLGFNDNISPRIMMSDVSNQEDKETIKKAIDDFSFQGYTDIGMALKQAQFIYESASKSENSPIVLLFTDGKIEIDEEGVRTYSESINDINEVLRDTKDIFPIYTIGLNNEGNVDQELLQNIADATDGRCYVTNSPKDLPSIFNEIFADHIKSSIIDIDLFFSDGITYRDVPITIPDDNVIEANIIIFSEKELIDTKIIDPNGNQIETTDSNAVVVSKSAKYSIIKLLSPPKGEWVLSVNGQKEDLIKVNLLFDYEIYLNMDISPQTEIEEGETINVKASFASNNSDEIDPSLSNIFSAYLIIVDKFGNELEQVSLTRGATSGSFETSYKLPKEFAETNDEITLYCVAESDRVSIESQSVNLTIAKEQAIPNTNDTEEEKSQSQDSTNMPTIKSEIKNITINYVPILFGKTKINLSNHFENASNYTVSDAIFISWEIQGDTLTLIPKSQNSEIISVTATNDNNDAVSLSFRVSTFNFLPYILIILAIMAVVISAYFIKKHSKLKNTLFSGNIRMTAIDSQGSYSPPELIDLSFTTGVTSLRNLVQRADNNTLPLHKILIYPGFDDKGLPLLGVINKSNCVIIGDFDIKISDKKFMWHNNLTITIKDENNAEASIVELIYRN